MLAKAQLLKFETTNGGQGGMALYLLDTPIVRDFSKSELLPDGTGPKVTRLLVSKSSELATAESPGGMFTAVMPKMATPYESWDKRYLFVPEYLTDDEALARIGVEVVPGLANDPLVEVRHVKSIETLIGATHLYEKPDGTALLAIESPLGTSLYARPAVDDLSSLGEPLARVHEAGQVGYVLELAGFVWPGEVGQDGEAVGAGESVNAD